MLLLFRDVALVLVVVVCDDDCNDGFLLLEMSTKKVLNLIGQEKDLIDLNQADRLISFYNYDFQRKQSSKSEVTINYEGENQLLILEGIFAHRLDLNYNETINIVCEEEKDICFKRKITSTSLNLLVFLKIFFLIIQIYLFVFRQY